MHSGCTAIITLTKDAWKTDPELKMIKQQEEIEKQEELNALNPAGVKEEMAITGGPKLNGIVPINSNHLNDTNPSDMKVDESVENEQYHVLPMYRPFATEQQIDSMVMQG